MEEETRLAAAPGYIPSYIPISAMTARQLANVAEDVEKKVLLAPNGYRKTSMKIHSVQNGRP